MASAGTSSARSARHRSTLFAVACLLLLGVACSNSTTKTAPSSVPDVVWPRLPAALFAGGGGSMYAPGPDRTVLAWGDNQSGQLGVGDTTIRTRPGKGPTIAGHKIVQLALGTSHALALVEDGSVWAWGHNRSGQLGDGGTTDRGTPKRVSGIIAARAVAAGAGFSMALEADGSVWAWGNNQSGQLGDGNAPIDHVTPAKVYGLGSGSGVVEIAAGDSFGLIRKRDGSVFGWGNGTSGQLGDGSASKRSAPTPVAGFGAGSGVVAIAAGGSHSLAIKRDGSLWAWGNNASGQVGDNRAPVDRRRPAMVLGLRGGVIAVAAGTSFSLALQSDGRVFAWGHNKSGQLGNGTTGRDARVAGPVALPAGAAATAIAATDSSAAALLDDGEVITWGNNSHGQLGDGTMPTDQPSPVVAVSAGPAR